MQGITLEVTLQEAAFITNVIGELPSKTGASGLYERLKQQVEQAQNQKEPANVEQTP